MAPAGKNPFAGKNPAAGRTPEYWIRFLLTVIDNLPAGTKPDWAKMASDSEKLWKDGSTVKQACNRLHEKFAATLPLTASNVDMDVPPTVSKAKAKAPSADKKRARVIDDSADNNDPEPPTKKRVRSTNIAAAPSANKIVAAKKITDVKKDVDFTDPDATESDGGQDEN